MVRHNHYDVKMRCREADTLRHDDRTLAARSTMTPDPATGTSGEAGGLDARSANGTAPLPAAVVPTTISGAHPNIEPGVPAARSGHVSRLRRPWVFGVALLAIVLAAGYITRYFSYAADHPSTDDAYVQGDSVTISAKVSGRIGRVLVRGYQSVRKGQLLVELDPVDIAISVQQAEASLAAARTGVQQAQAAVTAQRDETVAAVAQAQAAQAAATARVPQSQVAVTLEDQTVRESILMVRAQLSSAEAQIGTARSNLIKAQNDLQRATQLFAAGAIAAQQVDQAQAAYDAAQAQDRGADDAVTQARAALAAAESAQLNVPIRQQDVATALAQQAQAAAGLETARAGFDVVAQREAELAAARAAVVQAEAQLAAVRQQWLDTHVTAPADAVVGSDVPAQPGQVVQLGQPLLTLVFSSQKWVEANFKETQLGRVRDGQSATVRIDLTGQTFHGRVERLGPATGAALSVLPAQNATGNFTKVVQRVPVRIALDAAAAGLQIGLSVEATIDTTDGGAPGGAAEAGTH